MRHEAALVAVAHGSSYPEAARTVTALARQVSRLAPVIDIRVAFVQHAQPSLPQALRDGRRGRGHRAAAAVGRLSPEHGHRAGGTDPVRHVADPLGPDQLLVTALIRRLAEAGVPQGTPVVLAAAGSSDPLRREQVAAQADLLAGELQAPGTAAFAATGQPTVANAVADLRPAPAGRSPSPATCSPPGCSTTASPSPAPTGSPSRSAPTQR